MLRTFEAASEQSRAQHTYARFVLAEFLGLIFGAAAAWISGPSTPRGLATDAPSVLPSDPRTARRRVTQLVDRMVLSIAARDFIAARAYSFEEQEARLHLHRLEDPGAIGGRAS